MQPLKSKKDEWAQFQFSVYKRIESWCRKVGIDPKNIEYAPLVRGTVTVKQPDIILNIVREPSEPMFSYYINKSPTDGALKDFVDQFFQENEKMNYKVVIDPTIWEPDDPERWKERIERMKEYRDLLEKDTFVVVCFPVIVHPYGWDHSLDHGIEDGVHVITLNHLKDFLDSVYQSTNFLEPTIWISKIFKSKYDNCPICGNEQLNFAATFNCLEFPYPLIEETIENFTTWVETDDNKPPVEEQTLCRTCLRSAYCDGFIKTFDCICKKCGWTDTSGSLNPCSLVLLNGGYSDDCFDCSGPHECETYKKLKDLGVIHSRSTNNKQGEAGTKRRKNGQLPIRY